LALIGASPAMAQTAGDLDTALRRNASVIANCPTLLGVTIGDPANKATWSASFSTAVSPTCQTNVATVISNFALPPALPTSMQIASTGTPALNGTYAVDAVTQQQISGIQLYLVVHSTFPTGQSAQVWPDIGGTLHTFDATHWTAFTGAMADFMFAEGSGVTVTQPVVIP